jgi:hypothetical protein
VPGQFGELKGALNAAGYPKCKKKGSCVSIWHHMPKLTQNG